MTVLGKQSHLVHSGMYVPGSVEIRDVNKLVSQKPYRQFVFYKTCHFLEFSFITGDKADFCFSQLVLSN